MPHSRQTIGLSAATSNVGGLGWPSGHTCSARREYIRRREFSSSVPVPKVLRIPGTPGRWCMASEAGTYSTSSTCALGAWVIRLRVYVDRDSRYLREPSAYSTPRARDDFPDPETPAMPTILLRGMSTSTPLRLWTLAPLTTILSAGRPSMHRRMTAER